MHCGPPDQNFALAIPTLPTLTVAPPPHASFEDSDGRLNNTIIAGGEQSGIVDELTDDRKHTIRTPVCGQ